MANCVSCNNELQPGAKTCHVCGTPVQPPAQPGQQNQVYAQSGTQQAYIGGQPMGGPSMNQQSAPARQGSQDNDKTMAILSYIFWFVPLIAGAHKNSPFVKFHANQGLILFLASMAANILIGILIGVVITLGILSETAAVIFLGYGVAALLYMAYGAAALICIIMGIMSASKREMKQLPLIGKFVLLK